MSAFRRTRQHMAWQHSGGSAYPGDGRDAESSESVGSDESYVLELKRGVSIRRRRRQALTRCYWTLRILVIAIGGAIATISATAAPKWLLGLLGALAAGIETILTAGNFQRRAAVHATQADRVSRELRAFELGVAPYDGENKVHILFQTAEALRDQASSHGRELDSESTVRPGRRGVGQA